MVGAASSHVLGSLANSGPGGLGGAQVPSYWADRMEGQGSGVLVLVRRELQVSRVVSIPGRPRAVDCVGVVALCEASLACDLVSINDSRPTYIPGAGSSPSNIDLILGPLILFHLASVEVVADPFGLDHLPVVLELASAISAVPRPSRRAVLISGSFNGLSFMSASRVSCRSYILRIRRRKERLNLKGWTLKSRFS